MNNEAAGWRSMWMNIDKASEYIGELKVAISALDKAKRSLESGGEATQEWLQEVETLRAKADIIQTGYKASAASGKTSPAHDVELVRAEAQFIREFHDLAVRLRAAADEMNEAVGNRKLPPRRARASRQRLKPNTIASTRVRANERGKDHAHARRSALEMGASSWRRRAPRPTG